MTPISSSPSSTILMSHNRIVDRLHGEGVAEPDPFVPGATHRALALTVGVLHDFLPRLIGDKQAASLLTEGPRYFRREAAIPLEFTDAA